MIYQLQNTNQEKSFIQQQHDEYFQNLCEHYFFSTEADSYSMWKNNSHYFMLDNTDSITFQWKIKNNKYCQHLC